MNIFVHCQKLAHEHTSLVMSVFGFHVVVMTTATIGHEPNESLSDQMDYLIAPLDFSEVTSGLLLDRGFRMMNVEDFDGQMNIEQFSPKENGDSPLGTFQGTFQFTVTNEIGIDTIRISEGRFQFDIPQIF